jgi:hypothetical protein
MRLELRQNYIGRINEGGCCRPGYFSKTVRNHSHFSANPGLKPWKHPEYIETLDAFQNGLKVALSCFPKFVSKYNLCRGRYM